MQLGLVAILQIIFVIAKLMSVVNWSWLLVFAPVIVSSGLTLTVLLVAGAGLIAVHLWGN